MNFDNFLNIYVWFLKIMCVVFTLAILVIGICFLTIGMVVAGIFTIVMFFVAILPGTLIILMDW